MPDRRLFAGDPLQAYVHQGGHHCAHKRSDHIEPWVASPIMVIASFKTGLVLVSNSRLDRRLIFVNGPAKLRARCLDRLLPDVGAKRELLGTDECDVFDSHESE
jgi:hypothetical protein